MWRMASWETPWMSFASFVILLGMLSLTVCGDTLGKPSHPELQSAPSCPDPEVIAPCQCTFNATLGMDMDCSNVTSEDDLRRVFNSDFEFTNFTRLKINKNHNITSLREGDLGSVSFIEIDIFDTSLSEIEDDALKGSFDTLVTLDVIYSSLKSVPDISAFTRLNHLNLHNNQITKFPNQASATLFYLDLSFNHIDDFPQDAIIALPSLAYLDVSGNSLTKIHQNTFTRNENLRSLNLEKNRLTTIPDDAITFQGQHTNLYLGHNQITGLTYEALSSVTEWLDIDHNNLTEMPEKVFRPLLENSVNIYLHGNPFKCGCDMAWLVLNQTLLNRLFDLDMTRCSDGEMFADLDPEVYKVMCPNATALPL